MNRLLIPPFNRLFGVIDAYARPAKNRRDTEHKLTYQIKALEQEAKKLLRAATDLSSTLNKNNKGKDIEHAIEPVVTAQNNLNDTIYGICQSILDLQRARLADEVEEASAYGMYVCSNSTLDAFVISATLPNVAEEDIAIKIQSLKNNKNESLQKLCIKAKRQPDIDQPAGFLHSEIFKSIRTINGRREELAVEDGNINIIVDLPPNVSNDLLAIQETMTFENGILTLSFPVIKTEQIKEQELKFINR
ncbi:Hsp20/alpha crystallin family protein [Candidatus Dependentiae bacterium]|nr:Hsp20/alpha crystallin family protein [Candidatus Dependentiae bacterium]